MQINKIVTAQVAILLLAGTLSAKECIDFRSVNVGWTSYKTMAKIGVSGTFKDVKLLPSKNKSDIKSALVGTSVKINMQNITTKATIKTTNILKYFVPKLATKKVDAKIISVGEKRLNIELIFNKIKQIVPMNYTIEDGAVVAKGAIDARDFGFVSALKNLNTHVPAHKNKGWLDVAISFQLAYKDSCH